MYRNRRAGLYSHVCGIHGDYLRKDTIREGVCLTKDETLAGIVLRDTKRQDIMLSDSMLLCMTVAQHRCTVYLVHSSLSRLLSVGLVDAGVADIHDGFHMREGRQCSSAGRRAVSRACVEAGVAGGSATSGISTVAIPHQPSQDGS